MALRGRGASCPGEAGGELAMTAEIGAMESRNQTEEKGGDEDVDREQVVKVFAPRKATKRLFTAS